MSTNKPNNKTEKKASKHPAKGKQSAEELTTKEGIVWTIGILLLLVAMAMSISYTSYLIAGAGNCNQNWLGSFGTRIAKDVMEGSFGVATYFVPIFLLALVFRIFQIGRVRIWKWFLNCAILMIWFSVFGAYLQQFKPFEAFFLAGGTHGLAALDYLKENTGPVGTFFIIVASAIVYILYLSGETIRTIRRAITAAQRRAAKKTEEEETPEAEAIEEEDTPLLPTPLTNTPDTLVNTNQDPLNTATTIEFSAKDEQPADKVRDFSNHDMEIEVGGQTVSERDMENGEKLTIGEKEPEAEFDDTRSLEPYDPKLDLENYKYPTIDLLKRYDVDPRAIDMEEQRKNKNQILTVLSNFGVEISSIKATVGPTITLYEITPAPGVRISRIRNLEDDIALSLSALGIRIIAPIPGKGTIGIEVPNAKPQMVSMESIINSRKFQETEYELPMALGKTITNEIFMVDLAKMPHLLVAGATGQGKSVGLNAIITSLLYKKHPAELKLVMVDPKKVEFSVYNPIVNHFLAQVEGTEDSDEPIITDVTKVILTLKSLCQEMDTRYDLLKKARARNLKEYNQKFKDRQLNPNNGHKFMPYIVVIIDEFGDLIMTAGKEIELPIARIAQLARAVGIHMIIATQRPTTNIITGTIKANFPARMAFKVSSMIDSRTILDRPGANQLVGKGDMLFLAGNEPVRVQCAFVDTPEVENIASYIACQQSYDRPFPLPEVEMDSEGGDTPDVDMNHLDPMFEEVARLVVSTQQGSTSMIQRKFSIGYNRAGRLMDQLEVAGIVGAAHGSKPREVLCQDEHALEFLLNNLN